MNRSQKLRIGTAAILMIAGCSDQGGAPVAPVARETTPFGVGAGNPEDRGTITIRRTTDVRSQDQSGVPAGAPPRMVRRESTVSMATGRVALRNEDLRMHAALKVDPAATVTTIRDLPITGLSFPAGNASLRRSIVPWRRSERDPSDPDAFIESSGMGDAPASTIRYVRNGLTVVVVEQQWELSKGQWLLLRREASTPDGSVHATIDVSRSGRAGAAVESPADWASRGAFSAATAPSFDIFDDGEDCDVCFNLRLTAEKALAVYLLKQALAVVACAFAPIGLAIPVCVAAEGVALEAGIESVSAALELIHCERNKAPCPTPKQPSTDCTRRSAGMHHGAASFSCGSTNGTGTGGGGGGNGSDDGGGGGGSAGHYECTYYYEYDLYTGDVYYSQLLYCGWIGGS